jgi:hypothetical protein
LDQPAEGWIWRGAECGDQGERRRAVKEPYPFPDIWDPLARVFDARASTAACGHRLDRAAAVVNYEQLSSRSAPPAA